MLETPLIVCIDSRIEKPTSLYARFKIGPIMESHGLTIGNALRRILLSELKSLCIIAAKIKLGNTFLIPHEYCSLPGVREPALDLLLNLRQVTFQSDEFLNEPLIGFLNVTGPKTITAKDLKLPQMIRLIDENQYIGTLTDNSTLSIQFLLSYGKNGKSYLDIDQKNPGFFWLEPNFLPITQVNYKIESNSIENHDEHVLLEVTTNGSIHPYEALRISVKKLQNLINSLKFNPFYLDIYPTETNKNNQESFFETSGHKQFLTSKKQKHNFLGKKIDYKSSIKKRLYSIDLTNLNFSLNAYTELKSNNFNTIGDILLVNHNDLTKILSKTVLDEIEQILRNLGFLTV